jgi:hypothetical protein
MSHQIGKGAIVLANSLYDAAASQVSLAGG